MDFLLYGRTASRCSRVCAAASEQHRATAESVLSALQRQNCVALQQPVLQCMSSIALQQSLCSVHYTASELRRAAAECVVGLQRLNCVTLLQSLSITEVYIVLPDIS